MIFFFLLSNNSVVVRHFRKSKECILSFVGFVTIRLRSNAFYGKEDDKSMELIRKRFMKETNQELEESIINYRSFLEENKFKLFEQYSKLVINFTNYFTLNLEYFY
jgi:hypothetical protein